MVKLLTYSVLLCSLLLGCAAGIVDPAPIEPGVAGDYFWSDSVASVNFTKSDRLTSQKTSFTLNFVRNSTTTQVNDINGNKQFSFRTGDEGIYLEGLTKVNPLIPLPEGFTLDTIITTYQTTYRPMKRVLVVDNDRFLAVDHGDTLFVTNDRGLTWTANYPPFSTITCWTIYKGYIFVGTEAGEIYKSPITQLSWTPIIAKHRGSAITTLAPYDSLRRVYFATKDSVQFALDEPGVKDSFESIGTPPLKGVTSLAVIDSWNLCATSTTGIYTIELYAQPSKWNLVQTPWQKAHELVVVEDVLYALGEKGLESYLITGKNTGTSWSAAVNGALKGKPQHIASTGNVLLTATESGLTTKYTLTNLSGGSEINLERHIIHDLSGREGTFAVATDSGIYILATDGGTAWKSISNGPLVEKLRKDNELAGSLLLLKSGDLEPEMTWNAGKCFGSVAGRNVIYYITAKVSATVDELSLASLGGDTYSDVLPVQYIFSPTENSTDVGIETPRLVIYYAREFGPVLIQQYLGKTLIVEIYRD